MAVIISRTAQEKGSIDIMDEIKELYFGNATLHLDEDEQTKFEDSKPDFMKFLEQD